jgi:3-hydroxyisobutyrate dehydrogenase-like beta-hydroxyacid dehydrogenase
MICGQFGRFSKGGWHDLGQSFSGLHVMLQGVPLLGGFPMPLITAVHVGPHGAGQHAKPATQIIVRVTIGAVAEALMMAERGGAAPAKVREALRGGFAVSRIVEHHADRMGRRDVVTRGRLATHQKDLDNALDAAGRLSLNDCPCTVLTAALFRGLLATAGDLDHSGLLVEIERRNGLARE